MSNGDMIGSRQAERAGTKPGYLNKDDPLTTDRCVVAVVRNKRNTASWIVCTKTLAPMTRQLVRIGHNDFNGNQVAKLR